MCKPILLTGVCFLVSILSTKMPLPDTDQVNKEFVIAMEDYPLLYNYTLVEYNDRNEQDRAWQILAEQFQATDTECKVRWRNIRNAVARYLRLKNANRNRAKRPYYLWDHVQYLLPFIKTKSQLEKLENSQLCQQPQASTPEWDVSDMLDQCCGEIETGSNEEESQPSAASATTPLSNNIAPTSTSSSLPSSKTQATKIDPVKIAVTKYFEKNETQNQDSIANADLSFLTSLLPDVTSLPPKKKRLFKRKVMDLLDELIEDD